MSEYIFTEVRREALSFLLLLRLRKTEKKKRRGKVREQDGEIIVELEDYILKHPVMREELLPVSVKNLALTILPEKISRDEWNAFLELLNSRLIQRSEKERKLRIAA